jgi:hypothetical protein
MTARALGVAWKSVVQNQYSRLKSDARQSRTELRHSWSTEVPKPFSINYLSSLIIVLSMQQWRWPTKREFNSPRRGKNNIGERIDGRARVGEGGRGWAAVPGRAQKSCQWANGANRLGKATAFCTASSNPKRGGTLHKKDWRLGAWAAAAAGGGCST